MSGLRILRYALAHWSKEPKLPALNERELKAATMMIEIANSVEEGDFDIISEQYLHEFNDDEKDLNWNLEDEECQNMKIYDDVVRTPGAPNAIQFGKVLVELTKVQEAVQYYGSKSGEYKNGKKSRPSLATMHSKFTFIRDDNHLKKLRDYEKNGAIKASRANNLEVISLELEKVVRKYVEDGKILHDSSLRHLIMEIIKTQNIDIPNFKASSNWLAGWKRRFGLSSRKITKFVANVRHRSREQIEKDAKEFVEEANKIFPLYHPSSIFNCDQSGFQLEMHTARTLAFTGSKDVHCTVQSVSSTTHSYTVLPVISADGKLSEKLFVTLQEKNGDFPQKGHFPADNLDVTCGKSHIMKKDHMQQFFSRIIFDPGMPKDILLIVDSWSSWRDAEAIKSVTPPGYNIKILMIPPGCTGLVQPCDVGIFGGFKKVMKRIAGHVQLQEEHFKIHSRDEILKVLSLVWHQLRSPKLEDWVKYSWHASGYDVPRPPHFQTPSELLFPQNVSQDCSIQGCQSTSFIKCLHCENFFCFQHFVEEYHITC